MILRCRGQSLNRSFHRSQTFLSRFWSLSGLLTNIDLVHNLRLYALIPSYLHSEKGTTFLDVWIELSWSDHDKLLGLIFMVPDEWLVTYYFGSVFQSVCLYMCTQTLATLYDLYKAQCVIYLVGIFHETKTFIKQGRWPTCDLELADSY